MSNVINLALAIRRDHNLRRKKCRQLDFLERREAEERLMKEKISEIMERIDAPPAEGGDTYPLLSSHMVTERGIQPLPEEGEARRRRALIPPLKPLPLPDDDGGAYPSA